MSFCDEPGLPNHKGGGRVVIFPFFTIILPSGKEPGTPKSVSPSPFYFGWGVPFFPSPGIQAIFLPLSNPIHKGDFGISLFTFFLLSPALEGLVWKWTDKMSLWLTVSGCSSGSADRMQFLGFVFVFLFLFFFTHRQHKNFKNMYNVKTGTSKPSQTREMVFLQLPILLCVD